MVRKEGRLQLQQQLEVKVPSFFRCPISLEVMRSPVSLCTGVTYDRASIQRWLESGHTTCPATMVPLPSTDLVPNLTLRRLIHIWSSSASPAAGTLLAPHNAAALLRNIKSSSEPLPHLLKLADSFSDADLDDSIKNNLISAGECAPALASIVKNSAARSETLEAAIRVFSLIFTMDCFEERNKKIAASSLLADLDGSVSSLLAVLNAGSKLDGRIDAARVLEALLLFSDEESKILIAEKPDLAQELIRLIGTSGRRAVNAGLACLIGISTAGRRERVRLVQAGLVPALARVLSAEEAPGPAGTAEMALRLMEAAAGCAEGRAAICERAEECVGGVVGRMMKVGREGREAAVAVLWAVCHAARDPRARAAVAGASGGLAKILLLMQGDCAPPVRRMSGDLLRVFRVDTKSCLAAYNTKTTHIMPF